MSFTRTLGLAAWRSQPWQLRVLALIAVFPVIGMWWALLTAWYLGVWWWLAPLASLSSGWRLAGVRAGPFWFARQSRRRYRARTWWWYW